MHLKGKHIILGITGSIAAYKAAYLTRELKKQGADVKIIMTPLAKEFITPVTLATLSQNTVLSDFFKYDDGYWNNHVELGIWADLMLIAPATANTIAKMAHGIADNLLLTTYLSARCPVMVAPAMDLDMFQHPAVVRNMQTIQSYGNIIIEPATGELASGLEGKGRMEEPANIIRHISAFFDKKKSLIHKKVLVNAGPTYEAIDPVRFIGNHSSGKMGYAIASELVESGAEVFLISGPVELEISHPNIHISKVTSAEEMYNACTEKFREMDAAILSAAVADYTPADPQKIKIKKQGSENHTLTLKPTKDIANTLGQMKNNHQRLVGFALETESEQENARQKLKSKNLDFIVLNSLQDEGAGFRTDTNKITIIDKNNKIQNFELSTKRETAKNIVRKLTEIL